MVNLRGPMKTLHHLLIDNVETLNESCFSIESLCDRAAPSRILMCEPRFFEIKDSKNPFMSGHLNDVDVALAKKQWQELKKTFETLGYPVSLVRPVIGLEDMVFTANQVLPAVDEQGNSFVILAEMKHESRRREVVHFAAWFEENRYRVIRLNTSEQGPRFEGQGDAIWHPGKKLLWGGYGFRTEEAAYNDLVHILNVPILKLRLIDALFYHLDTAFCAIDHRTVMIYAPAFAPESLALIKHVFERVVEVSHADATNFACNAVALGKNVVLQRGSSAACRALEALNYESVEVDTGEFMKSGGSVFCLKMQIH